ncbi:hypothetical protein LR48_Vigan07g202300 [Vigna angularis]|uniref:PHD-type zinc finger plants domain-containing protein n=2 Tax=Phaseolus angularis TaxID=3914 RepID=A0A0L9V0N5_PHAAN|nr:uncharacterized protein LOC108337164 [Vigna angularis]KAG2389706.1 uncharacterized protein HKW66_Vig0177790 [Vigna angularis]KOM48319.1 hypothetical protein LR48_Vigan07g202300 [Vigna angularis]BAT81918.1 hypothetical protein VIGAN_03183100 [Vigna angularis var. angularis]
MTTKGTSHSQPNTECCMCGDLGFSDQLFHCKVCQFRSQHRYCSNLYPEKESVGTCNWCLSQREDTKEKSTNSSNSSSSIWNNDGESRIKKIKNGGSNNSAKNIGWKKGVKGSGILHLQIQKPIKKPKSPESSRSPSASTSPQKSSPVLVSTRKRIVTNGALEERLRRTRSEDIAKSSGATKQVFRNKVRRYKLLEEVSS